MKNEDTKTALDQKLTTLLKTTSALNIKPQQKLKILEVIFRLN